MKENLKKILYFLALFAYAVGVLGGIGYALYGGSGYFVPACLVVLAVMAFPEAKRCYNKLME